MTIEDNPYAAPRSSGLAPEPGDGPWRDGDWVVVTRWSRLPDRCVRCGAPATARRRCRPERPVDLAPGPPVEFGLCPEHALSPLFWRIALGWLALFALIEPVLILTEDSTVGTMPAAVLGVGVFVMGVVLLGLYWVGMRHPPPLRVEDLDRPYFWLAGAHPGVLDRLAEWAGDGPGIGPWRDGEDLVVGRRNRWPERCLRCGAPAVGTVRLEAGIALLQRQRLPACREHRKAHRIGYALMGMFVPLLLGWVALIFSMIVPPDRRRLDVVAVFAAGGVVLVLFYLGLRQVANRLEVVVVRSSAAKWVRLGRIDPGVLDGLHPWPR